VGETEELEQRRLAAFFADEQGRPTEDPARAVHGEIAEVDRATGRVRRVWFFTSQTELRWLPVSEPAFLLWVLAALLCVWLLIGVALGLI
jgi:hypothetical protein